MLTRFNIFNRRSLATLCCCLLLNATFAAIIGEHKGGDTGTGGESGGSGNNVFDGNRKEGKGENTAKAGKAATGGGGDGQKEKNDKKTPATPPEATIVRFYNDGPTNPNLSGPLIYDIDRVQDGKPVEKVKFKTDDELMESVARETENRVHESFNREPEDAEKRSKPLSNGFESDTENLKKLLENAKGQAREEEQKNEIEAMVKMTSALKEFQKYYGNMVEEKAVDLAQKEENTDKGVDEQKNSAKSSPAKMITAPSFGTGAMQTLKKLSMSIFNLIVGDSSGNETGNAFRNYFNNYVNKGQARGDSYLKSSLQESGLLGRPKNFIQINDRVRENVINISREFLSSGATKIQYSQDANKRNGPLSFDCSGFVTYVYYNAGLDMRRANGRAPSVMEIAKSNLFYEVVDKSEAKVGDLILQFGEENDFDSNHVGIYSGTNSKGKALYISATVRGGEAVLNPPKSSSIVEYRPEVLQKEWHLYRWKKQNGE